MYNLRTITGDQAQGSGTSDIGSDAHQLKAPFYNPMIGLAMQNGLRIGVPPNGLQPQMYQGMQQLQMINPEMRQNFVVIKDSNQEEPAGRSERTDDQRRPPEIINLEDSSEEGIVNPRNEQPNNQNNPTNTMSGGQFMHPMANPAYMQFMQQPQMMGQGIPMAMYGQAMRGNMMQMQYYQNQNQNQRQMMYFLNPNAMSQLQQVSQGMESWMNPQHYSQMKPQMMTQMPFQTQRPAVELMQNAKVEKVAKQSKPIKKGLVKEQRSLKGSAKRPTRSPSDERVKQEVQNNMVSINKTRVKINLKKLKEMESDILEVDKLDLYRTRNQQQQAWDLRKRVKRDPIEDEVSDFHNPKIKTYTRTAMHLKPYTERKISTRRTHVEDPKVAEPTIGSIGPQVLINNDGFMRIGTNYQADLSKISTDGGKFGSMRAKLMMQRVWNGGKDSELCITTILNELDQDIMDKVREQVYPNVCHYDVIIILNHFRDNLPLLQRKLSEHDPIVAHELLQLNLSFKHKRKFLKKYQPV